MVVVGSCPTNTLSLPEPRGKPVHRNVIAGVDQDASGSLLLVIFVAVMFWQGTACAEYWSRTTRSRSTHPGCLAGQAVHPQILIVDQKRPLA